MMIDAGKDDGNFERTRRHQRAAPPPARWRCDLAAYVPRAPASQLSAVFLGTARLARRHVDATNSDELVCLSNYKFENGAGCLRCHGIRSDDVVFDLGRFSRR